MREFDPSTPLGDATVQEIQWELLRRAQHNALDGEQVLGSLMKHRSLWTAVLLDRQLIWARARLPIGGLIKLRDLPDNDWNADTVYILCEGRENGRRLAEVARGEDWGGEVIVYDDQEEVALSLGGGPDEYVIIKVWWD
ncbi:MAG TPA: hypothetical protein VML55_16695 [Planctomycetaceae bacterium]|nr:hypothetical protein [Planctomycetaceae bacterium]